MANQRTEEATKNHQQAPAAAPLRGPAAMQVIDPDEDHEGITSEGLTGVEGAIRGEIDIQIATARKYPRLLKRALANAGSMATLDGETAAKCFYVVPRDGKHIEGPSIRLAEIFASAWGNFRCGARIVDEGEKFVTVQGYAHDLETNLAVAVEIQRRITKKNGQRFSDDMIVTTLNAAQSIALRNAVFRVIPRVYVDRVCGEAKKVAVGDASTLVERRHSAVEWFKKAKVSEAQLLAHLGKTTMDEVGLEELAILLGISTAIREGTVKIDALFPPVASAGATGPQTVAQAAEAQIAKVAAEAKAKKAASAAAKAGTPAPDAPAEAKRPNPDVQFTDEEKAEILAAEKEQQ